VDSRLTLPEDAVPSEAGGEDRILTLPNLVTLLRLGLLPFYLWLLFARHDTIAAAIVLAVVGATDWVDGQLARRLGQVSNLGKIIDPVADRILMLTAVISIAWVHAVPLWFAGLTLAREVLISAATMTIAALGGRRIDVLFIGKAGTFALMVAYPSFLLGHGPAAWQAWFRGLGWVVGSIGLVLSWAALLNYVGPARAALVEGRAARSAR
jgi:cardiolipin synthase